MIVARLNFLKHSSSTTIFSYNIILFIALLCINNQLYALNDIPMYPTPEFSKVERICKELWSDLDVLSFNKSLEYEWIENSNYLVNQFTQLSYSITSLVNTDESRSYLLEDIHYLVDILNELELRYSNLLMNLKHPLCQSMNVLLLQSKQTLKQLLLLNQEIMFF